MSNPRVYLCAAGLFMLFTRATSAVDPNLLEDAYWRFEEGADGQIVAPSGDEGCVQDVSGNENHLRRAEDANAPVYTVDVPGPVVKATGASNQLALRFNGFDHYVYSASGDINNGLTLSFTLEATFKADVVGTGTWHTIVTKESRSDDYISEAPILSLKIRGNDGHLMFQSRDVMNSLHDVRSLQPLQAGRWYHAAVVATPTEVKLYLNDGAGYAFQGSAPVEGGGPMYLGIGGGDYDSRWVIGRGSWSRLPEEWFVGVIDEVRLSNGALTPAKFLWAEPVPGSFDEDLDVDAADYEILRKCMTGPDVAYPGGLLSDCTLATDAQGMIAADLDRDFDVDQEDFAIWQRCFSGENRPGDPKCH